MMPQEQAGLDLSYREAQLGETYDLPRLFPEIPGSEGQITITAKDDNGVVAQVNVFGVPFCVVGAAKFTEDQPLDWSIDDVQ